MEGAALLEAVAQEMVSLFSIAESEAVARINHIWGDLPLLSEDDKNAIGHREPDEWALLIYYGREQQLEHGLSSRMAYLSADRFGLKPVTLAMADAEPGAAADGGAR